MTDFPKQFCSLILKDLFKGISSEEKARDKARFVQLETSTDGCSVRTQRHWKAVAAVELHIKEADKKYLQLAELDSLTQWSEKLHQERFSFVQKYPDILDRYLQFYKGASIDV